MLPSRDHGADGLKPCLQVGTSTIGHVDAITLQPAVWVLQDADDRGGDAEAGQGAATDSEAVVSFSALYDALGRRLAGEGSVLLLYLLLHGCRHFQVPV